MINNIHKVLLVEPCYENFGGYFRAFGIAKSLAKKKIHVDLLISSNKKLDLLIRSKKINDFLTIITLPRIEIHFFINGRILRGVIASIFILLKKYDIIHLFAVVHFESNIPLILFSKTLGHKIIVDWDDYWTGIHKTISFYNKFGGIIPKYFRFCEYTVQKIAKYATATSDFLINELNKIGINKTHKIINCVDPTEFTPIDKATARVFLKIPKDEKFLLVFGNTFFKERTIYLLRFFEKLQFLDPSIKLYINIDPKKLITENCPEEVFEESIFNNIINVGFLNKKQLSHYSSATDAILFLMGETSYEKACFPIRVGAFINSENVIITNETNTEACKTLKEYDSAVVDRDMNILAQKTVSLLRDSLLQKKYQQNVKRAKQALSWNNQIEKLLRFYTEILSVE